MSPILEAYIQGDKGAFNEIIEAITKGKGVHGPELEIRSGFVNRHSQDVRKDSPRAKDVIQTRKGYVSFVY